MLLEQQLANALDASLARQEANFNYKKRDTALNGANPVLMNLAES